MKKSRNNNKSLVEDGSGFEQWGGYMEAKKSKLQEQFFEMASGKNDVLKSNIFKGISIFVNGYTVPSADELKYLMMEYGGIYHHYYFINKTTYMVASNLPAAKLKLLKNVKVIKPEWVVNSISDGKMLDYRSYLLFTDCFSDSQSKINFNPKNSTEMDIESKYYDKEQNNSKMSETNNLGEFEITKDEEEKCVENNENKFRLKTDHQSDNLVCGGSLKFQKSAKTASDDNFINEFYNNSRLHHIATMGATFKEYVNEMRSKRENKKFPGREDLKKLISTESKENFEPELVDERTIMHIDMDCFFVSVGIRKRPELKGKSVVVTHAKGNTVHKRNGMDRKLEFRLYDERCEEKLKYKSSEAIQDLEEQVGTTKPIRWFTGIGESDSMSEIACCSYEARKMGIKNGMLLGQALKLCPNLYTIPYDFDGYKEVSYALYDYISSFTLDIEAVSCDEMFVDCTEILSYTSATPMQLATFLRKNIMDKTGCPCSTGFGPNILLARFATKKAKPNGQFHIKRSVAGEFLQKFPVSDLPGVGYSISSKLRLMGITTCEDLQNASVSALQLEFGNKMGLMLYQHSQGVDDRELNYDQKRKSVSADVNYGIRFQNQTEAEVFLKKLSEEVANRLHKIGMQGRCITFKLMVKAKDAPAESAKFMGHGVCNYFTKSVSLAVSTSDSSIILQEILKIVRASSVDAKDMRGIGIQISRLEKKSKAESMKLDKFLRTRNSGTANIKTESKSVISTCDEFSKMDPNIVLPIESVDRMKIDQSFINSLPEDNKRELLDSENFEFDINNDHQEIEVSQEEYKVKEIVKKKRKTNNFYDVEHNFHNVSISQIDYDFLDALPEDIRLEIKTEIEKRARTHRQKSLKCAIEIKEDSSLSEYIVIENNVPKLKPTVPLEEMKLMINEWIAKVTQPESSDVFMLSNYLKQRIYSRDLEIVDIIIRLIYRLINKSTSSGEWNKAYENIINNVQTVMKIVYGHTLLIPSIENGLL